MYLHQIKSPKGSRKRKRRVGRGQGSGWGKTAGRGENGQGSRRGRSTIMSSEGGQIALIRRLPKVGFRSHRPILNQVVHVGDLGRFQSGDVINAESLKEKGLIASLNKPFKILADGEIKVALTVQARSISKAAQEKIEKAGGKIEAVQSTENQSKPSEK